MCPMTATFHSLTLYAAASDTERLATALAAVVGADLVWYPAILPDGSESRATHVDLADGGKIVVWEREPAALPPALTLTVPDDVEAAVGRLDAAGFAVTRPPVVGLAVKASATVAGVSIGLVEAAVA